MPNRFEQLYNLPDNLYSDGSPVILSKGVLSKDSQTGSIIIQLKFHNVSAQVIKALKVSIITYDVTGVETEESCDYQYLDLKVKPGEDFGSKKAIIVSNSVSRSFKIKSITVVTGQDSVQEVSMPLEPLPEPDTLQNALNDPELVKQYQLTVSSKATYVPQEMSSLWQCTCGEWNSGTACTKCHAEKSKAFSSLDASFLRDEIKQREEKETAEAEKRKDEEEKRKQEELEEKKEQEEKEAVRKKELRRKNLITAGVIVVVAVIVIGGIIALTTNNNNHDSTDSNEHTIAHFDSDEEMIESVSGSYIAYQDDEPYLSLTINAESGLVEKRKYKYKAGDTYRIEEWDAQEGKIDVHLSYSYIINITAYEDDTVTFMGDTYQKES